MRSLTELDKEITAVSKDIYTLVNKITDPESFVETDKFIGANLSEVDFSGAPSDQSGGW